MVVLIRLFIIYCLLNDPVHEDGSRAGNLYKIRTVIDSVRSVLMQRVSSGVKVLMAAAI